MDGKGAGQFIERLWRLKYECDLSEFATGGSDRHRLVDVRPAPVVAQ